MPESPLDAVDQLERLRAREQSPAEVVEAAVERARYLNPTLNAIVEPTYGSAIERAEGIDPGAGALAGLPIAIKDYVQIAAAPVFLGNRVLKELDVRPEHTAATARRLADAGAINLGTTHAPEFAAGNCPASAETALYGPSRNPWDPTRTPMGSSGGSAAAVAAGIVAIAHGSDGGGSIRIPAAACGLVGLKPSRHLISAAPGAPLWSGFVTEGVLTRTVRDSALGLDVLAGSEIGDDARPRRSVIDHVDARFGTHLDAIAIPPGPLRIGFTTDFEFTDAAPSVKATVEQAATTLAAMGHRVENTYPEALAAEDPLWPFGVVMAANNSAMIEAYEHRIGRPWRESDMEPGSWMNLEKGRRRSATELVAAINELTVWSREVSAWWEQGQEGGREEGRADGAFDILVTPTLGADPPPIGTLVTGDNRERAATIRPLAPFTWQFNITGHPAISLPLGWSDDGLPIGVQLVADHGRDDLLLRLAAQLEAEYRWPERIPPIWAEPS